MIDKHKIIKVDVFNSKNHLLLSSDEFNVIRHENDRQQTISITIKPEGSVELKKGTKVEVVFYYINGDRTKYDTKTDVCTEYQLNITIGSDFDVLKERRRFYKLKADIDSKIVIINIDGYDTVLEEPIICTIRDINIGGIYMECESIFKVSDVFVMHFELLGKKLNLTTKVLRLKINPGRLQGYGCCFINNKPSEEEVIARFINHIQRERMESIKNKIKSR